MRRNRDIRLMGRDNLRGNYLVAIANMILIGLASIGLQWLVGSLTGTRVSWEEPNYANISASVGILNILLTLIASFVVSLLGLGYQWGFLDMQDGEPMTVGHLTDPFRYRPMKAVGFIFLKQILILLWSLLLVIPGIVKALSWSMAEFLYHDEPDVSNKLLLDKSESLMRGHRWQLLRLELFYVIIYFIPYFVWVLAFAFALERMTPSIGMQYEILLWILGGIAYLFIVISILLLLIEPRRRAARAVFYTELVALEENE